jgi:4-diphosphocytidyl-2-C-methyl-D-erythritol kinase
MHPRSAALRSAAKINLDLRVLHKRPDGYHELRTIFQTVSLADTIEMEFTPSRPTRIQMESEPDIPNNLMVRAAEAVLNRSKARGLLRLRLRKRIPMGGGLGGGSSNAASVLLALPVLTGKPLSMEDVLELGAELGSDVPFFLFGGTAAGLGRGTELYAVAAPPVTLALLVTPGVHVSTSGAYQGLARPLTANSPSRIINNFQSLAWRIGDTEKGGDWEAVNDFETVVFSQHPQLKSIKGKLLKLGACPALMSGSGSTVFGIFADRTARDQAALRLKQEFGNEQVHPVSLIGRSRYRSMWWRQLQEHMEGKEWPPRSRYA